MAPDEPNAPDEVMRFVVDNVSPMLAYWDRDLRCRFANRAHATWFGVSSQEMIGRTMREVFGPAMFEENEACARAALRGEAQSFERVVAGPDGTHHHLLAIYTPDLRSGQVLGFIAHLTDVTTIRQAEAGLGDSITKLQDEVRIREVAAETRYRGIVEGSPNALLVVDAQRKITLVNRQAEALFGRPREALVGQSIEALMPVRFREAHPGHMAGYLRAPSTRGMGVGRDLFALRSDGTEIPVEIGLNPLDDQTTLAGVIDISGRKRQERELQRSNAELEQFAYVASHDLQEPLRMVANYTELLAQRYQGRLDEKADKYIHYAVDGARRMSRLVTDLLLYSRVGTHGKALVPVDLAHTLGVVKESLRRLIKETGAAIDHGPLPVVMADEAQMQQLFQNLIANAIKFRSEAAPRVTVNAEPLGGDWQITVADNGIGIDMKHAERIFQMFQRLHEIGKYEGSGIGLAIVKRIVERHGGTISVESEPGSGSTFRINLRSAPKGTP